MRDAEEVEFPATPLPRVQPREPLVWIRVGGRWRPGRAVVLVHERTRDVDRWVVWANWRGDEPASQHAWLLYDRETIKVREGDKPPPG